MPPLPFTKRQLQLWSPMYARLSPVLRRAGLVILLSAAFTWFEVYGGDRPAWVSFLMWVVTLGTGIAASVFIMPFIFGTRFEPWPLALRILAGSALIAVPVTVSLLGFSMALSGSADLPAAGLQYFYVLAISVVMVVGGYVLARAQEAPSGTPELTAPDAARAFLARLPMKFREAELHAVSSEDHYLRVHTSLGEELILMRLADAVRELQGAGGLQVHRSWWVATGAVRDVKRQGGKVALVLPSGKEAPVSRTFMAEVKAAGLI